MSTPTSAKHYDSLEGMVDAWLAEEIDDAQFSVLHQSLAGGYGRDEQHHRVWRGRQLDDPTYLDTLYLSGQITEIQLERLEELVGEYE